VLPVRLFSCSHQPENQNVYKLILIKMNCDKK
jgi:hypothetical protein